MQSEVRDGNEPKSEKKKNYFFDRMNTGIEQEIVTFTGKEPKHFISIKPEQNLLRFEAVHTTTSS